MKPSKKHKYTLLILAGMLIPGLTGFGPVPTDALKLTSESLKNRSLQTRQYEDISEADLLAAAAGVIQDLGFNIDEIETKLGLIVGSKERDATVVAEVIGTIIFDMLTRNHSAVDEKQTLRLSLVVRPTLENDGTTYFVRVTFQRIVWDSFRYKSRLQELNSPEMYQVFFNKLSKAVFLEGKKI